MDFSRMKKILLVFLFVLPHLIFSQVKSGYGIYVFKSDFYNKALPYTLDQHLGPFYSVGFEYEGFSLDNDGNRFSLRSKMIGDLIWLIVKEFKSISNKSNSQMLTSDALGLSSLFWIKYGWSVYKHEKFNVGFGFNTSDYLYSCEHRDKNGQVLNPLITEPSGWWFAVGANNFIDFQITDQFSFHSLISYDFSLARFAKVKTQTTVDNYKKPFWLNYYFILQHSSGFYLMSDLTQIIDRGNQGDKTKRFDIGLGYRF
jgi:hypothetical protein